MESNEAPDSHVTILETAFGELSLDEEAANVSMSPAAISEAGSDLFEQYKKCPASSFERPSFFRVIHSVPIIETNGGLYSRRSPPLQLENFDLSDLCLHVTRHASLSNRRPTPFISLTFDLMRAFHLAFCTYATKQDVTILLICPWMLNLGSYMPCNDLRVMCGLPRNAIYNTEILVWGQVPAKSIIHRWERTQLLQSGLTDVLPSLSRLSPEMKLVDVRNHFQDDFPSFSPRKVAETLVKLGMEPSLLRIKQIYLFLLGQCAGFCVEKEPAAVEKELEVRFPQMIQEFEQAVHQMTVSAGRRFLRSYYENAHTETVGVHWPLDDPFGRLERQMYQRRCRKLRAILYEKYYCPDFKSWWVRREESDLGELEAQQMTDCKRYGLQRWLRETSGGLI